MIGSSKPAWNIQIMTVMTPTHLTRMIESEFSIMSGASLKYVRPFLNKPSFRELK